MALFSFFIQKCVCVFCQVGQWQCFSVSKTFNKVLASIALDRHHICHKLHKFPHRSAKEQRKSGDLETGTWCHEPGPWYQVFHLNRIIGMWGRHCISIWIYIIMFIYMAGLHISASGLPNSSNQHFMLSYHKTAVLRYQARSLGHYHTNGAQYRSARDFTRNM